MATKYKALITTAGAIKLAAAVLPDGKKVNITAMAVGDGGGKLPEPNSAQTGLVKEVYRAALNKISLDKKNKNYLVAEMLIPPESGGFWMREMGLYDDAGVLIAVSNMAESYKPLLSEGSGRAQTLRMVIMVSDINSVELSIDNSAIIATKDYVDELISDHEQSVRHPDATLTGKGFTQLSNATDSDSQVLAATTKAVKMTYDLANSKYTAQDATVALKGIVKLSSVIDSTSEEFAATPKAVKTVYDFANGKYTAQNATTAQKGIVQLSSATNSTSEVLAATPAAVKATYDLANGKYTALDATTARKGLVQLNSVTNSDSETLAATPKAVKAANDNANGRVPNARKVNGHALSADINVTSSDIFNGQAVSIGNAQNLNAAGYQTPGLYYQSANVQAASGANYPEANAGSLEVYKHAGITQVYRIYNSSRCYSRSFYGNAWSAWAKVYDTANKPTAAEVNAIGRDDCVTAGFNSGNVNLPYMRHMSSNTVVQLAREAWVTAGFQPKGSYTPTGTAYTKAESDTKYQPKGSYTPAGQAYTKAESDARYQLKNTASKAVNGWHKDASTGIITQWGYIANAGAGLTFPIAFPSTCASITIANAHSRFDYSIAVNTLTRTGATFHSESSGNMYWQAIGY